MSSLFLQSEVQNPHSFYQKMIEENPVYWDEANKIWAVYSYEYCSAILKNTNAHISAFPPNENLNQCALEIIKNLARLSNGIHHEIAKETAVLLFSNMKIIGINLIMEELLQNKKEINWVDLICKRLPILSVLKSFDFNDADSNFIVEEIAVLVKIMQANKTIEDVKIINEAAEKVYLITKEHISTLSFYKTLIEKTSKTYRISLEETISICICNLIGLFIQSYDACRGLLSNSLLQIFSKENSFKIEVDKIWIQKVIVETLRFDPPIHNTKRVAAENICLDKITIKKNDSILVVLAGANLDSKQFINPMNFDMKRKNNHENLTFGTGGHMCLAKYFSINLTTDVLHYLFYNYEISILENKIEYEPMINARLPKAIWISLLNKKI